MRKKEFYRIQAEAFKDYFSKFSDRDLPEVFGEWADSKMFNSKDRKAILKLAEKDFLRKTQREH